MRQIRHTLRFFLIQCCVLFVFVGCGVRGYGAKQFSASAPRYHRVSAGDTLSQISVKYGVGVEELMLLNELREPERLRAGDRLLISFSGGGSLSGNAIQRVSLRDSEHPRSGAKLQWPVAGGRLVSSFGPRKSSFHDGIDIACPSGTPVFSAHTGTVMYSDNELSGYGNLLIIRGDDRLLTVYAHNRRLLVRAGSRVRRGQKIAEVGSTGRSSGPHLHFEVRMKDLRNRTVAVDPVPLLNDAVRRKPRYRVNESLTPLLARISSRK